MYENIKQVGLPQWSDADQALAKAVQRELKVPERGLDTKLGAARRAGERRGAGPAAAPTTSATSPGTSRRSPCGIPSNIPNLPGHNWSNAIAMATPIAHKGVTAGAKVHGDDDGGPADEARSSCSRPGTISATSRPRRRSISRSSPPRTSRRSGSTRRPWTSTASRCGSSTTTPRAHETYLDQLGIGYPEPSGRRPRASGEGR